MWTLRAGRHPATGVPTQATREEEEKKVMARRRLTLEEQLKGIRAAIQSKKTPPQLREGLKKRAKWLTSEIRRSRPNQRRKKLFWRGRGTK